MTSYMVQQLLTGTDLSDSQLECIPSPRLEVHRHVLFKGVEMGAILGLGVVGPALYYTRSVPLMKTAIRTTALFTGLAPLATEGALSKASDDAIFDRAFRLRHNHNQYNVDRGALVGSLGLGLSTVITGISWTSGFVGGAAIGTLLATVGNFIKADENVNDTPLDKKE